jgi:membrane-associated phospholipid phosphatase
MSNGTLPDNSELKLFDFGIKKKLILIGCAAVLWIAALLAYYIPGFDHWLVAGFNTLRTNAIFAGFWYFYTQYMLYIVGFIILVLYFASFKVPALKPYRLTFFLSIIIYAIGTPIIDPLLKDFFARPRPWMAYPDINSLYHPIGFSFPSGHTFHAFAETLPLTICLLTNDPTFKRTGKKIALAFLLLIFAITLSFSRIFVGVHFLSDVLFGIGFALVLMVIFGGLIQWLLDSGRLNLQNEKWYGMVLALIIVINTIFFG